MITIGKPYIETLSDGLTRLCAVVNYSGSDEIIWYSVENKYSKYLCHERADAFLLAFLPYAMAFKKDIIVHGSVSERLYYHLTNYYIPSLSKFSHYYREVNIRCEFLDPTNYVNQESSGVATGFSGGVDSFFTVLKHINCKEPSYQLTHLTFFKVGATGSFGGEDADNTYKTRVNQFQEYIKTTGLEFVTIESNVSEHAKMSYNYIHTFRSMSAVLALQKLFRVYYYSSTATIGDFSFNVVDCANFDFFNLTNFSVEGVSMYSVGLDCERLDKQRFIQDYHETYRYLNVCNKEAMNCSRCEKCLRTMAGFQCLGSLEKYSEVFDVEYYKSNFSKCMGLLLGKRFDGSAEGNIDAVLIKNMKKSGIHIPVSAYIYSFPHALRSLAYKYARRVKPIRKWYHKKMSEELGGCNYQDD